MTNRRLLQVFLSAKQSIHPAVFEVSVDLNENLFCTCPGGVSTGKCKHITFVQSKMIVNNGTYPLEINKKAKPEEADKARQSNSAFRNFIIKFGRIEVY
jgi:ABC-type uncharacterized transport system ATPase component